ncbi:hypothetical protein [Flavobacterium sp.]|uniref:hypothetical protein n=1 Tax=Flavobacterium sp. TaxID=239 RepID=UPI002606AB7D|nr:hypothetical protein [Flavobacterium sp.]
MKKYIFILIICLIVNYGYSQKGISFGASSGFTTVDKEYGINGNFFIGYNTSKNIIIGLDGLFNEVSENNIIIKTNILMPYVEGGIPEKGMIKEKLYFSGIIGLGFIEQKALNFEENSGTIFLGTKLNYKLSQNFIVGIKTGYYFSKLDNVIIGNLFLNYKI